MATVKSQIKLLCDVIPTSFTNPTKKRFRNHSTEILGVVHILRVLMAFLETLEVPCDWMYVRDVLLIKSKFLGAVLGEKGFPASTVWVVPLYDETSTRM